VTHKFIKIEKQFAPLSAAPSKNENSGKQKFLWQNKERDYRKHPPLLLYYQFNIVLAQKIINKISARQAAQH
jgi:hypothetical protein